MIGPSASTEDLIVELERRLRRLERDNQVLRNRLAAAEQRLTAGGL